MNLTYNKVKYKECTTAENRLFNNILTDYKYNLELATNTRKLMNITFDHISQLEESLDDVDSKELDCLLNEIDDLIKTHKQYALTIERCAALNLRHTKQLAEMLATESEEIETEAI